MWHILMYQKHTQIKKTTLQILYRLRNIFNCVLPHWRHLTAGLLYNDFVFPTRLENVPPGLRLDLLGDQASSRHRYYYDPGKYDHQNCDMLYALMLLCSHSKVRCISAAKNFDLKNSVVTQFLTAKSYYQ